MLISVIMSVYNGEKYLVNAIESILTQTYEELELIIVNDASTDNTQNILDNIKDTRTKVIHLKKNLGAAHGLNVAVEVSSGQWIAVHDADDISYPQRLDEQVKYVIANKDLVAVGTYIDCIDENGTLIKHRHLKRNHIQSYHDIRSLMYQGCPLTHGTMFISREALIQAGKYNEEMKIAYDYDLWCRLVKIGRIENIPKKLYKYRQYNNSLSTKSDLETSYELFISFSQLITSVKNTKPTYLVIGTNKGCETFIAASRNFLNVKSLDDYPNEPTIKYLVKEYNKGELDGIIILRNSDKYDFLNNKLIKSGFHLNDNLYVFWSGV